MGTANCLMWVIHQSLYLVFLFVKIALSSLGNEVTSRNSPFEKSPCWCVQGHLQHLSFSTHYSILLLNPSQKLTNKQKQQCERCSVLLLLRNFDQKKDNEMLIMIYCLCLFSASPFKYWSGMTRRHLAANKSI